MRPPTFGEGIDLTADVDQASAAAIGDAGQRRIDRNRNRLNLIVALIETILEIVRAALIGRRLSNQRKPHGANQREVSVLLARRLGVFRRSCILIFLSGPAIRRFRRRFLGSCKVTARNSFPQLTGGPVCDQLKWPCIGVLPGQQTKVLQKVSPARCCS